MASSRIHSTAIPRTSARALGVVRSRLAPLTRPPYVGRRLQPHLLDSHEPTRGLIWRRASHLDAFSGYHCPTWLPGGALGRTTGTPAVGPSRSSRTRDSPSQTSYAHSG